jgi:Tfp pilus assembly PilM family ATPase/Tfp pilus assembly protein PilN
MGFSQASLGIDLREDRIVISHLKRSFKKVWVATNEVLPFSPGKGKEEREVEIINTIQGFITSQNVSKDNVIIALPREKALLKLLEIPSAAKENLRKTIEYELGKYIPFPPEEAVFDFQVLEEKEEMLRILLVVMRKEEVNEYVELFGRAGIKPVALEISSTASANLFYYDQHPVNPDPFALIDIRKHFFEFHFFEKGNLMDTVQRAFMKDSDRAKEVVEGYRLALLKGLGAKDGHQSLFAYGEEANESLINEMREWLSSDVASTPSLKRVRTANGLHQRIPEVYPSIGLALRGLSKTKWNINLLPLTLRKKISRIGFYLAIFLFAVSLVLAGALLVRPLQQEREELSRISAEVKERKPKVDAIEAVQKKREKVEKEVKEFETLMSEYRSRSDILKELSEILPPTAWVWNLRLKSNDLELNGFATSASDLISILDKSRYFEKVEFTSPVTKERRLFGEQVEKERFKISAKVERSK